MAIPPLFGLNILVCAQNEWYTQPIQCADAGPDTVITLSGFLFRSVGDPGIPDLEAFANVERHEVEDRIQMFLGGNPDVSPLTTGRVVMDIEKPFPSGLWRQPPMMRARLVRAFATRAEAARRKFPNAKLGFYGTLVPDPRGRENDPEYVGRKEALVKAGECGMFDEVDFLVPVIYPRWGPTDRPDAWGSYEPYTRLAIEGSRQIHKSNGSSLPVLPFLTCWIANENSKHAYDVLLDLPVPDPLDATLGVQFDVLLEERVRTAVVWVGRNTEVITLEKVNNPHARTVSDHICFRGPPRAPLLPS